MLIHGLIEHPHKGSKIIVVRVDINDNANGSMISCGNDVNTIGGMFWFEPVNILCEKVLCSGSAGVIFAGSDVDILT